MKKFLYKEYKDLPKVLQPDAIYFVLSEDKENVSGYVTDIAGNAKPLHNREKVIQEINAILPSLTLKGDKGDPGNPGLKGDPGNPIELLNENGVIKWRVVGSDAFNDLVNVSTLKGPKGDNGLSAYQIWIAEGNNGTVSDFLESLQGEDGVPGKSSFLRVTGSTLEWQQTGDPAWQELFDLSTLEGADGAPGKSAYELAVENGYVGTVTQWLNETARHNGNAVGAPFVLGTTDNQPLHLIAGNAVRAKFLTNGVFTTNSYVGFGTENPISPLHVIASNEGITIGEESGSTGKMMLLGYNVASNYAFIQSVHQGTAFRPLSLNASGGPVLVGGITNRGFIFDVIGSSMFQGDHTIKVGGSYDVVTSYNGGSNAVTYTVNGSGRHFQISSPNNFYLVTNGTRRMTVLASGNTIFGTGLTDVNELVNVEGSFRADRISIGGSGVLPARLAVSGQLTGASTAYGVYQYGSVNPSVTTNAIGFRSQNAMTAGTTLGNLVGFWATRTADGSGATVVNTVGFWADGSIGSVSPNASFGFMGSLMSSGNSKWNLYMNGTAPNYMAGPLNMGILSGDRRFNFYNNLQLTGGVSTYGNYTNGIIQLDSISSANGYTSQLGIVANGSVSSLSHFVAIQGGFGAGSTVSQQNGFDAVDLTGGVLNFGFRGRVSSGSGKWNLYMDGSADNYLSGNTMIGTNSGNSYYAKKMVVSAADEDGITIASTSTSATGLIAFADGTSGNAAYRGMISYSHLTDSLRFGAGGSLRAYLFTDGNFSIGNPTNNGSKLHVEGTASFLSRVTANGFLAGTETWGVGSISGIEIVKSYPNFNRGVFVASTINTGGVAGSSKNFNSSYTLAAGSYINPEVAHFEGGSLSVGAGAGITTHTVFNAINNGIAITNNIAYRGQFASGTGKWNLYMDGTADNYIAGQIVIGTATSSPARTFAINKPLTGASTGISVAVSHTIQSDVVTAHIFYSGNSVAANHPGLTNFNHFTVAGGTLGANATITNQTGFFVDTGLINGTNNFAFRGRVPAGTNNFNLYMDGAANNYLGGSLGIGTTALSVSCIRLTLPISGGSPAYGFFMSSAIAPGVTTARYNYALFSGQAGSAPSTVTGYGVSQGAYSGSSPNSQYGFSVESTMIAGVNNYGFFGNLEAGLGRWNLYMNGTAENYLNGPTTFTKGIIINYTPTSSTDAALGNGSVTADDSFLYRRNSSGTWKKIAWTDF